MEKQQYVLKPSLKEMALRKVAIGLWTGTDVINLVKEFRYKTTLDDYQAKKWHSILEKKVKEKISILVLPQATREELLHAAKPIGPEILKWKFCHESLFPVDGDILGQLCWTSVGTVDYRKTAEVLIKQERINSVDRCQLACLYCLNDDIPFIWKELPEDDKERFYNKESSSLGTQAELVVIWTHIIKDDEDKLNYKINGDGDNRTLYQYAFEGAAETGNKAATQYFFQKLTVQEREASLLKAAQRLLVRASAVCRIPFDFPKEKFCDVLCFLLSQMDEEDQMKVFKRDAFTCLRCFLNWPWQHLFMKAVRISWEFLSKENFYYLIVILACGVYISGCYFPKLFGELFLYAPSDYRKFILEQSWESGFWFHCLFYTNNTESIKLVLRNVDSSDRQRFILGDRGLCLCRKLIQDGKWILLELFIAECRLSEEAKSRLKDAFMTSYSRFMSGSPELNRFLDLINTANLENCKKRSLEDLENEEHEEIERLQGLSKKQRIERDHIFS